MAYAYTKALFGGDIVVQLGLLRADFDTFHCRKDSAVQQHHDALLSLIEDVRGLLCPKPVIGLSEA